MQLKISRWQVYLGIILVSLSALIYGLHFLFFHDSHHIFIYLLGDIAFVPIEVLLVTMILHKLLSVREKQNMMEKLNMIIGAFFSQVGTFLLKEFSSADNNRVNFSSKLLINGSWDDSDFENIISQATQYEFDLNRKTIRFGELKEHLIKNRDFLVRLLENPILLEHESFTDLLWAVFHLTEELENRIEFSELPDSDVSHLVGDIIRAYRLLVLSWINYMMHLKKQYPYLFSLAMRQNPFDDAANPVVKD